MGAVTPWPKHVLWRKWVCARNQELPTGKQSKERWIWSVTEPCAWGSGVLCCHHHRTSVAAQLGGGRQREMPLAIFFQRCSVPSSLHNPTACTSSAVPSIPGAFLECLIQGPEERHLIRAWSDHRHSDVFSIFEWKKLQLCPSVKVKDWPGGCAEGKSSQTFSNGKKQKDRPVITEEQFSIHTELARTQRTHTEDSIFFSNSIWHLVIVTFHLSNKWICPFQQNCCGHIIPFMVCFAEFQMLLFIQDKVQPKKSQKQKKNFCSKRKRR